MDHQGEGVGKIKVVGKRGVFSKVTLVEPATSGYIIFAAEFDQKPLFNLYLSESERKKQAIAQLKEMEHGLQIREDVVEASLFKAWFVPPGSKSTFFKTHPHIKAITYDLVMLIEFNTKENAKDFHASSQWSQMVEQVSFSARGLLNITASNIRRIAAVDHSRPGVFLFNYFFADNLEQNIGIWDYTAGWFMQKTKLDNSTVFLPDSDQKTQHSIINHCRWDKFCDVLIPLIFKKSFHSFVLKNFKANNTCPHPVLYKLV